MASSLPSLPPLSPLAGAIAQAEGYGLPNAIPTLANNPGNIEAGDVGNGTLQAAQNQQITVYNSLADGASALENLLSNAVNGNSSLYSPSMTLSQFGSMYSSGSTSGNPVYGNLLGKILGVDPSTTISQIQGGTATGTKSVNGSSLLSRAIVLILGIILFGAGILSFKTSQTVIQTTTKVVGKVGEHVGEIAAL